MCYSPVSSASFDDALAQCQAQGAQLALPTNAWEEKWLGSMFSAPYNWIRGDDKADEDR